MNFDEKSIKAIAKHNPAALLNAPELDEASFPIWQAFSELHEARTSPRLSILEIVAWLDLNEVLDPELRREYYAVVTKMDQAWKDWADANSKSRNGRPRNESGRQRSNRSHR